MIKHNIHMNVIEQNIPNEKKHESMFEFTIKENQNKMKEEKLISQK